MRHKKFSLFRPLISRRLLLSSGLAPGKYISRYFSDALALKTSGEGGFVGVFDLQNACLLNCRRFGNGRTYGRGDILC